MDNITEIIDKLSPIERKVVPFLNLEVNEIIKKSGLDETSALRALKFLENKGIIKMNSTEKSVVDLGTNGIYYKKNNLPERKLLLVFENRNYVPLDDAKKASGLSDNEFKVSLGVLKDKALISLSKGKISLNASREELTKKSLEEQLLDILPAELDELSPEQKFALENLKKRKDIVEIKTSKIYTFELTDLGKEIAGREIKTSLVEEVTPELIKSGQKNVKLRRYDILTPLPKIYGGKRHFVNQSIEYAKRIWLDMGFKEMSGNIAVSSFWNFDALFTPQDHPARELQDTFFLKDIEAKLPDKKLAESVKMSHEGKLKEKSEGWHYEWDEKLARKVLLRTHTTALSSQTLKKISENNEFPAKYFAIGKCFRNETIDWSHGFEFNQTEGIVVDENANFRQLLGYLVEFYKKMGYEKIRIRPHYFPYTEPSVEIDAWHKQRKCWIEVGGAGMFRPEVTIPFFGKHIPVLAWGPGFDRIIMEFFEIKDLRDIYSNDIKQLREMGFWTK